VENSPVFSAARLVGSKFVKSQIEVKPAKYLDGFERPRTRLSLLRYEHGMCAFIGSVDTDD